MSVVFFKAFVIQSNSFRLRSYKLVSLYDGLGGVTKWSYINVESDGMENSRRQEQMATKFNKLFETTKKVDSYRKRAEMKAKKRNSSDFRPNNIRIFGFQMD